MSALPVVIITGASSGIGEHLALQVARSGKYNLVVAARREKELNDVAAKCGSNCVAVVGDVSKREEANRVVQKAVEAFGTVDVLVNNVGRGCFVLPSALTEDVIRDMMDVNVNTMLFCTQAVLPIFREKKQGQVIVVNSLLGRNAAMAPIRSAYSASKYFVNGLTAAFRGEFAAEFPEIKFQTFSPGVVATDFGLVASEGKHDSRTVQNAQDPEDVARVLFEESIVGKKEEVYSREEYKPMIRAALSKLVPE